MKTIDLPVFGITVTITEDGGGASLSSDLKDNSGAVTLEESEQIESYNSAMDGIESMILAHACAGIDIESPEYLEGIETAVLSCGSQF